MKNRAITLIVGIVLTAGGYIINNYTGNDIVLDNGETIETKELSSHLYNKYRDREVDTVTVYLHHTVTDNDATIEKINQIHVNKGWEKLSYHIVNRHDGEINIINDFTKYTYHTKGKNKKGIAIALIGNYELEKPSDKIIESTRFIIDIICNLPNLYVESIKGHKDVKATLCPGKYAYEEFQDLFF